MASCLSVQGTSVLLQEAEATFDCLQELKVFVFQLHPRQPPPFGQAFGEKNMLQAVLGMFLVPRRPVPVL